jgi:hypothetical protein
MANERMIKVTGKGVLKVKPDVTRITMTLEGQNKEYDKIFEQSSKDTEALKDILEKHGFILFSQMKFTQNVRIIQK